MPDAGAPLTEAGARPLVARIAALIGNHTVLRDGVGRSAGVEPVGLVQRIGAQNVDEIAATVHDDVVAPLLRQMAEKDGEVDDKSRVGHAVADAWKADADRMRAALAAIRDRHRRHGDRCGSCGSSRSGNTCDACYFPHPCETRTTAERGLGEEET